MEIEEIKIQFLALIESKNRGYIITMEMIYNWLEDPKTYINYSTNEELRRKYRIRYLRGNDMFDEADDINDLNKDFVMIKNDKNISYPWFSVDGFKALCMALKTEKSKYVRKYFIQIEEDYLRVLKQTEEQNDKEYKLLNAKISEFNKLEKTLLKKVEKVTNKLIKAEEERDDFHEQNNILDMENKKYNGVKQILTDDDNIGLFDKSLSIELDYARNFLMKQIPIYIVNPKFMIKPTSKKEKAPKQIVKGPLDSSEESSDEVEVKVEAKVEAKEVKNKEEFNYYNADENEDEMPFNDYSLYDIKYNFVDEYMYYFVGGISSNAEKPVDNYNKIGYISVVSGDHLKYIKEHLGSSDKVDDKYIYKTHKASIYKCSYQTIMSFRTDYILEKFVTSL